MMLVECQHFDLMILIEYWEFICGLVCACPATNCKFALCKESTHNEIDG